MKAITEKFNIGEHVVYPEQGMGVVKDIVQKKRNGVMESYYSIYLKNTDMNLLIPVDRARDIGIRSIVSKSEATDAIMNISNKDNSSTLDWKERLHKSQELIHNGSIGSIAKVVQTLYHRSKIKELPIQEKKIYESALNLLIEEDSLAMSLDSEQISTLILERLES